MTTRQTFITLLFAGAAATGFAADAATNWTDSCAKCHGSDGKGDTKMGKKLSIEAGDEIVLKTGDASITMKKDGTITIKGKDITLDASGKIVAKASGQMTLKGSKIAEN